MIQTFVITFARLFVPSFSNNVSGHTHLLLSIWNIKMHSCMVERQQRCKPMQSQALRQSRDVYLGMRMAEYH